MRFGLYLNPQTPGPADDGRVIREVLDQVALAESLGFDDVWLTEHHFSGYNVYSDPILMAMAVAGRTQRMNLGFSLAVVPLHHPIRFVTQCNLLDQVSGGRLIVGVGPGNAVNEFQGYGFEAHDRHAMIDEFMAIAERAWQAPPEGFSYDGQYWHGRFDGRIIPAPAQKHRPTIAWATGTPETIEHAGRQGYGWLMAPLGSDWIAPRLARYFAGMEAAGLSTEARERALLATGQVRQIYVCAPGEDWRETIGEYVDIYVRKRDLANSGIQAMSDEYFAKRKRMLLDGWLLVGTAEELVAQLRPIAELGSAHLMCWVNFGHMPDHLVRQTITRLATDVLPALRDVSFNESRYHAALAEAGEARPISFPTR